MSHNLLLALMVSLTPFSLAYATEDTVSRDQCKVTCLEHMNGYWGYSVDCVYICRESFRSQEISLAKMSQDPVDDVLILNSSNDFDGFTAATANLDIDIEYAFESLGPEYGDVPFRG